VLVESGLEAAWRSRFPCHDDGCFGAAPEAQGMVRSYGPGLSWRGKLQRSC
jgi:hypothetical protein